MRREVVGGCALDCPDSCSWVVGVEDGVPVDLRGNRDHPFTGGGLCAKVTSFVRYATSPDRLLHPLRRVGPKGEGRFERITWDEALAETAQRLQEAVDLHGGEAIWPYAGTGTLGWVQGIYGSGKRLFHHLGASTHHGNICSVAGHAGMGYTTGDAMGLDPEGLVHSRLVLLWGTNTLTTNLHLWPTIAKARENGATVVVVDPVRTRTAVAADHHVAPRPGTDGALVLGILARLVATGAVDEEYLAEWTLGWPEFRDEVVAGWSPERAAQECGLDVAEVTWLADLVASSRPTGIRTLMGVQRHAGGGSATRLMSTLPAVTGDYARPGGGMCYSTAPAYRFDDGAVTRPDLRPDGPTRVLRMSRLGRELLERRDPPVTALVMWAANPVVSNPDQERVLAGLAREDLFTVVVDHVMTDTALWADLVLPGTTQLEHTDLHASYTHLYVHWNQPAVEPPGECRSHTRIFRDLAAAMGLTEPALFASDDELARAVLSSGHPALAGITPDTLRERGWMRLNLPSPYVPYADGFPTPSGRFEFVSARGAADGAGRLPGYVPPLEAGGGRDDGRLALVSAAGHWTLNGTFSLSPLHRRSGEPVVTVHPDDAHRLGVCDGALVEVSTDRGSFRARAQVSDAVRPGVAATTKGLSPRRSGGRSVNATTSDALSDLGAGATFHDNRVRVTPVPAAEAGAAGAAPGEGAAHGQADGQTGGRLPTNASMPSAESAEVACSTMVQPATS